MMKTMKRGMMTLWSLVLFAAPAAALQPTTGQSEFVPVSQLPQAEQLPAAPLLIAAYAFVWIALVLYLWSIWRRLGRVEADMALLKQRRPDERSTAR